MQRKVLILTMLASLLSFNVTVQAQKTPVVNFNPVVPDNIADPSVVKFNDTFYLYATTDIDQGLSIAGPPVVWKSKDFVNWSFSGALISGIDWNKPYDYTDDKGVKKTGNYRYWAPGKPLQRDGKYYLFPTIVKPDGKAATYVMTATSPNGPFWFATGDGIFFNDIPAGKTESVPVAPDIDGEPFIDSDGSVYLFWRRRMAAKLTADWLSLDGKPVEIPTKHGGYSEGPLLFKRKDIYYYIYTLSGHGNYVNGYMMSRKSPLGPFEVPEGKNIFIQSSIENKVWGPGHGNVFQVPGTDDFIFVYLEFGEGGTTRQVFANRMQFNADGTIVPVTVDNRGVGYLAKPVKKATNLATGAIATASSARDPKTVSQSIETNPNALTNIGSTFKGPTVQTVTREFTYTAQNAIDGSNGTRWFAQKEDTQPWFTLDLGKTKNISSCEMYFVFPAMGHAWKMERSTDGINWEPCAVQQEVAVRSPHIAGKIGKARFLRLTITQGTAGLWEMKVYAK
ncbi:MAG: family 43 glycosylhydrolase [Chitinophagaceae bacterium]